MRHNIISGDYQISLIKLPPLQSASTLILTSFLLKILEVLKLQHLADNKVDNKGW